MDVRMSRALSVGVTTFFLAIGVNFVSKILLGRVGLILGLFILFVIVAMGVVFDVIGTAATAARKRPFHAMAAKKVHGARQALSILGSADRVASFCNDVVGDMTGTVSGAVGVSIALRLISNSPRNISEAVATTLIVGIVAGVAVGSKAWSKHIAINEAEKIILSVGRLVAWIEDARRIAFSGGVKACGKGRPGTRNNRTRGDTSGGKAS